MPLTKGGITSLVSLLAAVAGCGAGGDPVPPPVEWVKDLSVSPQSIRMTGPGVARVEVRVSTAQTNYFVGQLDTTTVSISAKGPFGGTWELGPFGWRVLNVSASAPGTGSITVSAGKKSATIGLTAVAIGFKSISMSNGYGCGITLDDAAWCWGGNWAGELGTETVGQCNGSACQYGGNNGNATPLPVDGDHKFAQIATGGYRCDNGFVGGTCGRTCALTSAGELWCWGNGVTTPVAIAAGPTFTSLSIAGPITGSSFNSSAQSCGLAADQMAYCFANTTATRIANGMMLSALSVGPTHSCAVDLGGNAYCWGDNRFGQLGIGSVDTGTHATPERVAGAQKFKAIQAAINSTCALGADGAIYCWGLGYAADGASPPPACGATVCQSSPRALQSSRQYSSFSSTFSYACGLTTDGSVDCWSSFNGAPSTVALPEPASSISVGGFPTGNCAVSVTHVGYCWGGANVGVTKLGQ
jgi:alpha-tubulin suppressor-like RCC1 family protein